MITLCRKTKSMFKNYGKYRTSNMSASKAVRILKQQGYTLDEIKKKLQFPNKLIERLHKAT